jgi:hypothetical protein
LVVQAIKSFSETVRPQFAMHSDAKNEYLERKEMQPYQEYDQFKTAQVPGKS